MFPHWTPRKGEALGILLVCVALGLWDYRVGIGLCGAWLIWQANVRV